MGYNKSGRDAAYLKTKGYLNALDYFPSVTLIHNEYSIMKISIKYHSNNCSAHHACISKYSAVKYVVNKIICAQIYKILFYFYFDVVRTYASCDVYVSRNSKVRIHFLAFIYAMHKEQL